MTRNWTDYPITGTTQRKKAHITDLMKAYEERIRLIRNSEYYDIWQAEDYPLPSPFYYHKSTSKTWGTYPKADPAHWPPNQSPDNEFKNDHIYGTRGLLVGTISIAYASGIADPIYILDVENVLAFPWSRFYTHFIYKTEGKYKCFPEDSPHIGATFLTAAIGKSGWMDGGMELTPGSVYVKTAHIQEQQDCWEQLTDLAIFPHKWEYRNGSGTSDWEITMDAAWSAAKADFTWGSWIEFSPGNPPSGIKDRVYISGLMQESNGNYRATVGGNELRYTFDLDLEISDMGWNVFPPLAAKLVSYGLDTNYDEIANVLVSCPTISASNSLTYQDADGRGYLLASDITDNVGNGHSEEAFTFSSTNQFSGADFDAVRPIGTGTRAVVIEEWKTGAGSLGNAFIILEPDWHFGTE